MEALKIGINRHVHQQIVDTLSSRDDEGIDRQTETNSESHYEGDREKDEDKEDVQEEAETEDTDTGAEDMKGDEGIDEVTLNSFPVSTE